MASYFGRTPLGVGTENTYAFSRSLINKKEQDRNELR